jgi:PucR C-terminal helix-turn-helix domain/GGDEF-like domain
MMPAHNEFFVSSMHARYMYGVSGRPSDPKVAALASALSERLPQFAAELTERICQQVDAYREDGPVPRDDLYRSCRQNLEFGFRILADVGHHDLSAPRRTGRRRAEQGAPLAVVLSAYRIGFAYMWDTVVTEAERSGLVSATELVRIASDVWTLNEMFTTEMATSYRDAMTEQILRRDQERSALVEALVQGSVTDTATVWEAADLLGLPYQGSFVAVAAEPLALARQALPNIEIRLRDHGIGSAWRLLPDLHVGVVSLRSPEALQRVVGMVRPALATRVGVSPVYEGLEKTSQAMHLARIAMASVAPGDTGVSVFDDAPVAALIASAPTTSYRVMNNVLGPLLDTAAEERHMLLETLTTYFAAGSITEAGRRLYCHRNTVRHRLIRIKQLTGRSVDDALGAVELYIAVQTMLRLPQPPD